MKKRLISARKLLNREGYILINIDENELAQLKLLCDEIFDERNFVGIYMWEKTSTPPALSKKVRKKLEYILCYAKHLDTSHQFSQGAIDGCDAPLLNTGNGVKTLKFPKGSVKFNIADGIYENISNKKVDLKYPIIVKDGYNENDFEMSGEFKWTQPTLDREIEQGTYFIVKSKNFSIRYQRINIQKVKTPQNLINSELGVGTNETAAKEIQLLGLPDFDYPKPSSLYSFLVKMVNKRKDMTILDFFAGSGTTGDAVLQVNKELKSSHRFILCTNNQNDICRGTTYERIKRIIIKEGYNASVKYYKVDFIQTNGKLYFEYADQLLKHITELVELENGIYNGSEIIKILTEEGDADRFIDNLKEIRECRKIYIGMDILLSGEQIRKLKELQIEVNYIPDYYYGDLEGLY